MDEKEKSDLKRLNIQIDPSLRAEIKIRAASRHITLRKWIVRAIMEQIKREQQYES